MNATILPAAPRDTLHPLTVARSLSECRLAGNTLRRLQEIRLAGAGMNLVAAAPPGGGPVLHQAGDAWLSVDAIRALAAHAGPARLRSREGRILAWTAAFAQQPGNAGDVITDEGGSFDIRFPWDLLRVNSELVGGLCGSSIEGSAAPTVIIEGFASVGAGTRLLPGVFIEGNAVIGRDCKIGPNCYIRGNTSIGDNCHIGQAVEIKNCIIMDRTSIGHLSYCGDSVIGEHVNFGAGTIIANLRHDGLNHRSMAEGALVDTGLRKFGAIIGDNVHTGIHTAIYPGRKIWPNRTTRPGEVVKNDLMA